MHRFVDIEIWPLNKGQGKKVISYFNTLKVIEQDKEVKKASYWKKSFFYPIYPWIWPWPWALNGNFFLTIYEESFYFCSCKREHFMLSPSKQFSNK